MKSICLITKALIKLEMRSKDSLFSCLLFSTVTLFIFSFGVNLTMSAQSAAGLIWTLLTFSGHLLIVQVLQKHLNNRTDLMLLFAGVKPIELFVSFSICILLLMTIISLFSFVLFLIFFGTSFFTFLFFVVFLFGITSFTTTGVFFYTLLRHHHFREVILPVVFFPIITPVLITCVKCTNEILMLQFPSALGFLIGINFVIIPLTFLLYDFALEGSS